ncbi:GTPase [Campylobacter magnus]|uniref:GTPase n=1 Tax=Campylobacter magnus TaxID=3026462 RepID=UPI0026E036FA|nr:GTPase domain-containing protein [Campylobacter magnus]MDO2408327.1 GTPase domain-containing protein [Campylobacter magnus]
MSKLTLNLMVLGKTGAGKSSLVNYLAGSEVTKTGSGNPVTQKGDFAHINIPTNEKLDYNVYDSWGLEANKADEWKKLIKNKLESAINYNFVILEKNKEISEIFLEYFRKNLDINIQESCIHAVLYCVSCNSQRLEPFELDIIEEILKLNFKVLVVFTQADSNNAQDAQKTFKEILNDKLGKYKYNINTINVCANPVKKLGQKETVKAYGKEEIEKLMFVDIWDNILHRNLGVWQKNVNNLLDEQRKIHYKMIENLSVNDSFIDNFKPRPFLANDVMKRLKRDFDETKSYIDESLEKIINDTIQYYNLLCEDYFLKTIDKPKIDVKIRSKYDDIRSKYDDGFFTTALAQIIMHITPTVNVLCKIMMINDIEKEYNEALDSLKEQIKQACDDIYKVFNSNKTTQALLDHYLLANGK